MTDLPIEPLTAAAFAPFGEVIEAAGDWEPANQGMARRYRDLATLDTSLKSGRPALGLFRTQPAPTPITLRLLERHPLGSQAFIPMNADRYLVVVAPGEDAPDLSGLRAFMAAGTQGVSYRRGTWHHPLLALGRVTDFVVIDRAGPGENCDEFPLSGSFVVTPERH